MSRHSACMSYRLSSEIATFSGSSAAHKIYVCDFTSRFQSSLRKYSTWQRNPKMSLSPHRFSRGLFLTQISAVHQHMLRGLPRCGNILYQQKSRRSLSLDGVLSKMTLRGRTKIGARNSHVITLTNGFPDQRWLTPQKNMLMLQASERAKMKK